MTSIQPILKPKAKHNYLPTLVGFILVVVIVGLGYLATTRSTSTTSSELRHPLAVNPELKFVGTFEGAVPDRFLAENPEIISFEHYTAMQQRNIFAENPELTAVSHFIEQTQRNELAVNPELAWYYRYTTK